MKQFFNILEVSDNNPNYDQMFKNIKKAIDKFYKTKQDSITPKPIRSNFPELLRLPAYNSFPLEVLGDAARTIITTTKPIKVYFSELIFINWN